MTIDGFKIFKILGGDRGRKGTEFGLVKHYHLRMALLSDKLNRRPTAQMGGVFGLAVLGPLERFWDCCGGNPKDNLWVSGTNSLPMRLRRAWTGPGRVARLEWRHRLPVSFFVDVRPCASKRHVRLWRHRRWIAASLSAQTRSGKRKSRDFNHCV